MLFTIVEITSTSEGDFQTHAIASKVMCGGFGVSPNPTTDSGLTAVANTRSSSLLSSSGVLGNARRVCVQCWLSVCYWLVNVLLLQLQLSSLHVCFLFVSLGSCLIHVLLVFVVGSGFVICSFKSCYFVDYVCLLWVRLGSF